MDWIAQLLDDAGEPPGGLPGHLNALGAQADHPPAAVDLSRGARTPDAHDDRVGRAQEAIGIVLGVIHLAIDPFRVQFATQIDGHGHVGYGRHREPLGRRIAPFLQLCHPPSSTYFKINDCHVVKHILVVKNIFKLLLALINQLNSIGKFQEIQKFNKH